MNGVFSLKTAVAVLLVMIMTTLTAAAQDAKPRHAPNTLPGVEPEMLSPDYWIARMDDPDDIVMTPNEIATFNERVRTKSVSFDEKFGKLHPLERGFADAVNKGLIMNPLRPLMLPATLPGDTLRTWLEYNVDYLHSRDFYDDRNVIFNDDMRAEIVEKMNIGSVPDVIRREYGIIVRHTNVRYFPSARPGYSDTKWELDHFQATGNLIGEPVTVIHRSIDGDFVYIESPIARGWVDATTVAVDQKADIQSLVEDKNFVMATCDKVPVYADPACRRFSRYLYYAATMPLIRKDSIGYVVRMAYAEPDGSLGVTNGYIKPDADVSVGFLPYTKRNVITQLFKLLNKPYGWGDQDNKRSCAGTMRVLFRCFGFRTGRHPSYLLSSSDRQTFIDPEWSTEKKTEVVSKIEPFVTIAGSPGHVVLYIGKGHTGKLYYMHQAGWGYEDDNGEHLFVNRTTINAADHRFYNIGSALVYTTFRP